jgi:very-short-patch-repair endonuclease
MALQTVHALQSQGHAVTLYTFSHSEECFSELQAELDIVLWPEVQVQNSKFKIQNGGIVKNKKKSITLPFAFCLLPCKKAFNIITLAFHLRHVDIIIANNPPMQCVAALAKLASLKCKVQSAKCKVNTRSRNFSLWILHFELSTLWTVWWHHHVPWYFSPKAKNTNEKCTMKNVQWRNHFKNPQLFIIHYSLYITKWIKSFVERNFVIPFIDQMVVTSHFVAEKVREYCGREAVVVHPVIQTAPTHSDREYPRSTTTPLKGGLGHQQEQEAIQSQSPFQGGADEGSGGMYQKSGYWEYTYPANTKLKSFSHQMSREMTRAEQRLWFEVLQSGKTGSKWVKQKIIGNFIVDFYCHEKRLVIEVDGWVHHDQPYYDTERTRYLEKLGIRVIRYNNEIVLNQIDQVREKIEHEMEVREYPRSTTTPLKGGQGTGAIPVPLSRGDKVHDWHGGMQQDAVTLFTHGRLEAGKGLDTLVNIFNKLRITNYKLRESKGCQIHLIIFWTGSLETQLREEGIDVRPFRGQETFSELSTGKFWHVIGVYCSSIDAFGMASLESQMAGFPTVILDSGGASEAILSDERDEPVGYLVDSEESLFASLSYFAEHKKFPENLSNVNFSHKKDYFSPSRLSSDLLSLMHRIGD